MKTEVNATAIDAKPTRTNRILGLTILGLMLLVAGAGLALALMTQATRREHDTRLPLEMQGYRQKRNTASGVPVQIDETPGGR